MAIKTTLTGYDAIEAAMRRHTCEINALDSRESLGKWYEPCGAPATAIVDDRHHACERCARKAKRMGCVVVRDGDPEVA